MKNVIFISAILFIVFFNINSKIKVDTASRFFVDEYGRKRMYNSLYFIYYYKNFFFFY